jgi:hypothetical protein
MGLETEQDLTSHSARRRRVLAGVLAGAALAVPGVAIAAGGGSSSSSTADPAGDPPAMTIQESQGDGDRDGDGRDCPEERGGGSGGDGGQSGGSGSSSQDSALL